MLSKDKTCFKRPLEATYFYLNIKTNRLWELVGNNATRVVVITNYIGEGGQEVRNYNINYFKRIFKPIQ